MALINEQPDIFYINLNNLEPKYRVTAFLKFPQYVLSKQGEQRVDLSTLTDEQADELLWTAMIRAEKIALLNQVLRGNTELLRTVHAKRDTLKTEKQRAEQKVHMAILNGKEPTDIEVKRFWRL